VIRYDVPAPELLARIDRAAPGWQAKAAEKITAARKRGKLSSADEIWGDLKAVYYEVQRGKCIYCERRLPKLTEGSLESHVEHYRPKNRLKPWPNESHIVRRPGIGDYRARVRQGAEGGYLRLALDPFNYAVACPTCNSPYKHDFFPIAGEPEHEAMDRETLDRTEQPLLLFPLGTQAEDPAGFFDFEGTQIKPRGTLDEAQSLRANVTIDLLELDTRDDLVGLRMLVISALWPRLETLRTPSSPQDREKAESFIATFTEPRAHQAACARAFVALYWSDYEKARGIAEKAEHPHEPGLPPIT
jgi:hypothetical protein